MLGIMISLPRQPETSLNLKRMFTLFTDSFRFNLIGNEKILNLLIEYGASVEYMDGSGDIALSHASKVVWKCFAVTKKVKIDLFVHLVDAPIAEVLIQHGSNVNHSNENGVTPLHRAVDRGIYHNNFFKINISSISSFIDLKIYIF